MRLGSPPSASPLSRTSAAFTFTGSFSPATSFVIVTSGGHASLISSVRVSSPGGAGVSSTDHVPLRSYRRRSPMACRSPSIHTSTTRPGRTYPGSPRLGASGAAVKSGPSATMKLAALPVSSVPRSSLTPSIAAGSTVSILSALSGLSPCLSAESSRSMNPARPPRSSGTFPLLRATLIPAASSRDGFVGASSQFMSSRSSTLSRSPNVATLGASGNASGRMSFTPACRIASTRRNSSPLPNTTADRENSLAIFAARSTSSSSSTSNSSVPGSWAFPSIWSRRSASSASPGDTAPRASPCFQSASLSVCRMSAIAPIWLSGYRLQRGSSPAPRPSHTFSRDVSSASA